MKVVRRIAVALGILVLVTGVAFADKVDDLMKRLRDPDNKVRLSAALNLGKLGDKRAIVPLTAALKDSDKTVRGVAAAALGKLIDGSVDGRVRKLAIDALEQTARNDADAFVRGQAQKAFDAVKGLRQGGAAPGVADLGGKKVYVEVGPFSDASGGAGGGSMVSIMRRVAEKQLAREFAIKWPGGKSPSRGELSRAGVSGFYVDGTVNKIEVKKSGPNATVKCYVSMLVATWPEKSTFAFANNKKAEVDSGSSEKEIAEAASFCVEAQVEAMMKNDLVPAIRQKAP
jgi:HEAT repeats